MTPLSDVLESAAAKARKYGGRKLGEQNTKASLIEPVIEALGWDIRDPDEVHREYRAKGRDSPVDYALKILRKPRLFVEAKGLGESLGERRWVAQMLGYAAVAGVEWCVLTDGDEYRFYNAVAPVDADDKMFHRVRLTEGSPEDCAGAMSLVSKDNLELNLLESLWSVHFVDRRVKAALLDMIAGPDPALIRMVRKRAEKLTAKEIAESLRRLDVHVESPAVLPDAPRRERQEAGQTRPAKGTAARARRADSGCSLSDLIATGSLTPPVPLHCEYRGRSFEASVLDSGEIEFQGQRYATPSAAASAARETVTGRPMATNGWSFWRFDGADGQTRELGSVRSARGAVSSRAASTLRLIGGTAKRGAG